MRSCDVRQNIDGTDLKGESNDHHYHLACLGDICIEFDLKFEYLLEHNFDELDQIELCKTSIVLNHKMSCL